METEATCVRYFDMNVHKVITQYFSLDEIDYTWSQDGKSPDASAVFATLMIPMRRIFGESYLTMLSKHLVSASFDGASVMMGSQNSVASRLLDLQPRVLVTHACAHNLELGWTYASKEATYLLHVSEVLSVCYNLITGSLKATNSLKEMAKSIELSVVSLKAIHGIRWLQSQQRAVRALARDWLPLVLYFEETALSAVGVGLTTLSPRDQFLEKRITLSVEGVDKKGYIVECTSPEGARPCDEQFRIRLIGGRVNDSYILTKNEVIVRLAHAKLYELQRVPEWDAYTSLTQYRFVVTIHFLLDLEFELGQLSLAFQAQGVSPTDIRNGYERTLERVRRLKREDGQALQEFFREYDEVQESFKGINLEDCDEGSAMFKQDREIILTATEV